MVVITLTDCPPKVRGDLSKWLCEVNTGVYVGNLSARVRDELWHRVCENLKNGRATMVYSAQGEQRLNFEVHHALWEPVDLDGIKLMRRPLPMGAKRAEETNQIQSRMGKILAGKRAEAAKRRKIDEYVVIDVETTGLSPENDRIIEIGAILVQKGEIQNAYHTFVNQNVVVPREIQELTGINEAILSEEGIPIQEALLNLIDFVENHLIVCHNAEFDCNFLKAEAKRNQIQMFRNRCADTMILSRRKVSGMTHHTLQEMCDHFGFDTSEIHRALPDCKLTYLLFEKLNEI